METDHMTIRSKSDWLDERRELLQAEKALQARPGYHGALFNLAFAKSLDEDFEGALEIFQGLVASGVDYAIVEMEEFAALQELEGWADYEAAVHPPAASPR